MATVTLSTVHSKVQDLEDAIEQLTSTIFGDTANNSLNRKLQKQSNLLLNKNIQLEDQQKTISKLEKLVIYLSNIPGTSADDIWRPSRKVRKERGKDQMWEMLTKQLHTIMLKQPVGLKVYEDWTEEDSELSRQEVDCYISALTNYLQNNRRLTNPPPPAYTLFINTVNYYILNHHITFSQLLTFMLLSIYSMTCLLKLQHIRMLMVLHFSFNSDISFTMRKDTIIKRLNNFIWWDPADPATKEELTRLMTFNCPCPRHKTLGTPPDFTTFAAQAPRWSAIQKMTQPGEDFIVYCQLQHKINLYFEKHCDLTPVQKTDVQPPKACESKASKRKVTLTNQEDITPKKVKLTKQCLERTASEEKLTHHTAATNYSEDTEPYCDVEIILLLHHLHKYPHSHLHNHIDNRLSQLPFLHLTQDQVLCLHFTPKLVHIPTTLHHRLEVDLAHIPQHQYLPTIQCMTDQLVVLPRYKHKMYNQFTKEAVQDICPCYNRLTYILIQFTKIPRALTQQVLINILEPTKQHQDLQAQAILTKTGNFCVNNYILCSIGQYPWKFIYLIMTDTPEINY